jgi:hypothetical protein
VRADAAAANWNSKRRVASHGASAVAVSAIYPRPSLEQMYRQNPSFDDPNPTAGQRFPGMRDQRTCTQ